MLKTRVMNTICKVVDFRMNICLKLLEHSVKSRVFFLAHTQKIGEYLVPPRVVVFTDGRFTNFAEEGAREDKANRHPSDSVCNNTICITI